jgi:hypothetical protein
MELNEILEARKTLANHVNDKVCAALAYKIMKFLKSSDNEEEFYLTKMQEFINEYAEKDTDGNPVRAEGGSIKVSQEKIKECEKAIKDLGETNATEPAIKFNLSELAELKLSAKEMYALDGFIIT